MRAMEFAEGIVRLAKKCGDIGRSLTELVTKWDLVSDSAVVAEPKAEL
jgi:hypothetical protein